MFISKKNLEKIKLDIEELKIKVWCLENPAKYEVGDRVKIRKMLGVDKGVIIEIKENVNIVGQIYRIYNLSVKNCDLSEIGVLEKEVIKKIK